MAETMSNVDNFWLQMDHPTNLMVIAGFMQFDEKLDFDRLRATIQNRMLSFDRFKKRVSKPMSGVGVPTWETDPYFDLRNHLHRISLPDPGDKKMMMETVADLMVMNLDPDKPLWQCTYIENYGKGSALFFTLHHCIADGIALVHILLSMADLESDAPWPESKQIRPKGAFHRIMPFDFVLDKVKSAGKTTQKVGKAIWKEAKQGMSNPQHLVDMAKFTTSLTADMSQVLGKLLFMPSDPKTVFKGDLGVRKSVVWSEQLPLADIKSVGKAVGATVNDVLIGCVSGALRSYLQKRNNRVFELDLRVAVPVNIRRPGTEFELGNKFSLVFLSLPVHIEDPILRLKEVKRRMDHLKTSPDAFVGFQALNALGVTPENIAKRAAAFLANKATGVLTNVPGPRQPLYFSGKEIKDMMFWVPRIGRLGLGISIISYNNKITMGIATDEKLVSDPDAILDGFHAEYMHLVSLAKSGKVEKDPLVLYDRHKERMEAKKKNKDIADAQVADKQQDVNREENGDEHGEEKKCQGTTKSGSPCKKAAVKGTDYCSIHSPA
ncbi:wax ester/triacylglycerol synthase family O-acyltransferase [Desulfobacterales bacterium HSG17]|nr:wax ester/triacylglycerol synthase family O-acyltransferase [Desulfobacterales bacterium HSG17]